ncbi:PBIP1 protein, partial [Loxia leucoptera]|nr:PBIP1 protein [Loxia leucoptera]
GPVESVGSWDLAAGEQESLLSIDSNDSQPKPPLPDDGGPQSMQSMSQLLDKLAKENQEIRLMQAELQDSQPKPPLPDDGGPQSMQSMSQLLDKLAKENQEIRLMQAELQAHKEDLQALLRKSEGEVAAAGVQQQNLATENARLRA